jgi:hypothetical protein
MLTGLLWYDSDPNRGLAAKIDDAARRYREKFGQAPDTCYVSDTAVVEAGAQQTLSWVTLRIVPATHIRPHHFWVGREESACAAPPT